MSPSGDRGGYRGCSKLAKEGAEMTAMPGTRQELLRRMDLNMWAIFAEMTRLCRGGSVRQTATYTLCHSPRGTPFHNMVMVGDGAGVDEVLTAAADFFGASSR